MSEPPRGSGEGWRAAGWQEGAEQSRSDKPAEKEETIKIGSRSYGSGPQPNIDMAEKKRIKKTGPDGLCQRIAGHPKKQNPPRHNSTEGMSLPPTRVGDPDPGGKIFQIKTEKYKEIGNFCNIFRF